MLELVHSFWMKCDLDSMIRIFQCFHVVEGSEEEDMQARPVYVAAVDLACKNCFYN